MKPLFSFVAFQCVRPFVANALEVHKNNIYWLASVLFVLAGSLNVLAQLAPTGGHYAGRLSDTGHGGGLVNATGTFPSSIPLDLPAARAGIPIPLEISHGGRNVGAGGLGWDIPLSYIQRNKTFAYRRPEHSSQFIFPVPRERVYLSLFGQNVELIRNGTTWIARSGTLELAVREIAGGWVAYDGQGRIYTFQQQPLLTDTGLWLLKQISAGGGASLEITYQINTRPLSGGSGIEINLTGITYNNHPSAGCAKHQVGLTYGNGSTTPLSMSVLGNTVLTRFSTLTQVNVKSRPTCATPLESLRRYSLQYLPDADTRLPRLSEVRMFGRQGTPEENSALPVASYSYGAATTEGEFRYQISQTIPLPPDDVGSNSNISGTAVDSTVIAPGSGEKYAMWHNFTDVTGDGRADIVFQKNNKLWLAHNRPAANGKTELSSQPTVQFHDTTFQNGPFSTHTATKRRLWYGIANLNTINVWRQAIDVNGDGRLDVIDAAEKPQKWVVYLNTPGGTSGVKWERKELAVFNLGLELANRGHKIDGGRIPLSRRTTGTSITTRMCLTLSGSKWMPFNGNKVITIQNPNGTFSTFTVNCENGRPTNVPLPPPNCLPDEPTICSSPDGDEPERTYIEWDISDINGDGYPDFVFNSLPVELTFMPLGSSSQEDFHFEDVQSRFGLPRGNSIRASYNVVGARFADQESMPLSRSVVLAMPGADLFVFRHGVGMWEGDIHDKDVQRQVAGLAEVNGDGLTDLIVNRQAFLGTYLGTARAFSNVSITLPDFLSEQHTKHEGKTKQQQCSSGLLYQSRLVRGLRDFTGDGIPDYYDNGRVWVGTGADFATPVNINGGDARFVFSHQTESCNGKFSNTDGGLFDIDGDGKPEVIGLVDINGRRAYLVSQLIGGSVPGKPEAGRLTAVNNGYGATTSITYKSAKEDLFTAHQVPFHEIVVSSVETAGAHNLGGNLSATRYAYGRAELVFDSTLDRFTFPGYQRFVELRLFGQQAVRPEGAATVTDNWPLEAFTPTLTKEQRWLRKQRLGRLRDIYTLRGSAETNPWHLLEVDTNDPRVIGVTHYEWGAKHFQLPSGTNSIGRDCFDMVRQFSYSASLADIQANQLDLCRSHGFAFGLSSESWYGARAPSSTNNIQTRARALEVDDFGRVTFAQNEGDLFRNDDNVCVEKRFATPDGTFPRVLTALASRRFTNCSREITYASESWKYDNLPSGLVSNGRMTSHTFDRRATDNGAFLGSVRSFDAAYDSAGNVTSVRTQRDGAVRTVIFNYDLFGLVPVQSKLEATGVPTTDSLVTYDLISLAPLSSRDANQMLYGAEFDGFGRLVRSTVTPPGGTLGVIAAISYEGFSGADPNGRRVAVKQFINAVPSAEIANAPGRTQTSFFDELGRPLRTEVALGSDYANEHIVIGSRIYDGLGRVSFEADSYPKSHNPATAYGTSYHFQNTGDIDCIIRGRGHQALSRVTDVSSERFPTCFNRLFINNAEILEVQDAASLQAGSPQAGVVKRVTSSAIGSVIERSTMRGGVRLDFASFSYDRLGQQTSMTRFLDPASGTNPVQWSWRLSSVGQTLQLNEPDTANRFYSYSDWGEPLETKWADGSVNRRLVSKFDALGRLTSTSEINNGVTDPETVTEYKYDVGVNVSPQVAPTFMLGRLARASSAKGQVSFSYDAFGRVNARTFTDNQNGLYIEKSLYNVDGSLTALEFNLPDQNFGSELIKYNYDSVGRLRTINHSDPSGSRELYRAGRIDPLGRVREAVYGGKTTFEAFYADEGRRLIKEAVVKSPNGSFRQMTFVRFDPLGRELSRNEIRDGSAFGAQINTTYDPLGRLSTSVRIEGTNTVSNWKLRYDALGNVIRLEDLIGASDATLSYNTVADRDRLCRVGYGNGGLSGAACNVIHDRLGNVVSQPTRTGSRQLSFYSSGLIRTIRDEQGTQARFTYDPFEQVQELDIEGGTTQDKRRDRRYGNLIEKRDVMSSGTTTSIIIRHIPGPDGNVASKRGKGNEWVFGFGELRGNRFFTDEKGTFVQDLNYQPFGEATSTGAMAGSAKYTSYQWNGGDALGAFGLSHLGARIYDPVIGRFLSRDPLLVQRGAAATNPYAFAINDPLNAADPSGLDCIGKECEPDNTSFLPFGIEFLRGYRNGGSGAPQSSPQNAPPVSSGPQTERGKQYKFLAEVTFETKFGNAFDFDSIAQKYEVSEALERIARTQEVYSAIDEYNAENDEISYNARYYGLSVASGAMFGIFIIEGGAVALAMRGLLPARGLSLLGFSGGTGTAVYGTRQQLTPPPSRLPSISLNSFFRPAGNFQIRPNGSINTMVSPTRLVVNEYHHKDIVNVFKPYDGQLNLFRPAFWKHVLPHRHIFDLPAPPATLNANWRNAFQNKPGVIKRTVWPWQN